MRKHEILNEEELANKLHELEALKKDYEVLKAEADRELDEMQYYIEHSTNRYVIMKSMEGKQRSLKAIADFQKKIDEIKLEMREIYKLRLAKDN